ncbi:hypothetical protein BDW75DRAFT_89925 [Aspergillus navahoensis]
MLRHSLMAWFSNGSSRLSTLRLERGLTVLFPGSPSSNIEGVKLISGMSSGIACLVVVSAGTGMECIGARGHAFWASHHRGLHRGRVCGAQDTARHHPLNKTKQK